MARRFADCPPQRAASHELRPGVLDLWFIDLDRAPSADDRALLADDERARVARLIIPAKRMQAIRARAELRRVLARYVGCEPSQLRFGYGDQGKPYLEASAAVPVFNLSHSHTVGLLGVVAGLPQLQLGVDIEHARDGREIAAIARSFFAADEVERFEALAASEQRGAFYRAWTRKEAYLKAIGTGLSFPSSGFSITFGAGVTPRVVHTSRAGDRAERWQLADLAAPEGYAAAACWDAAALERRRYWAPTSAAQE